MLTLTQSLTVLEFTIFLEEKVTKFKREEMCIFGIPKNAFQLMEAYSFPSQNEFRIN